MSQSYPAARQVVRVPVGSTATNVTVTFHNEDGTVRDLSGATGDKLFHASTEAAVAVTTGGTAAFVTDGSDGQVTFPLTSTEAGTKRNLRCEFEVQGLSGKNIVSELFTLMLTERAKVV